MSNIAYIVYLSYEEVIICVQNKNKTKYMKNCNTGNWCSRTNQWHMTTSTTYSHVQKIE